LSVPSISAKRGKKGETSYRGDKSIRRRADGVVWRGKKNLKKGGCLVGGTVTFHLRKKEKCPAQMERSEEDASASKKPGRVARQRQKLPRKSRQAISSLERRAVRV